MVFGGGEACLFLFVDEGETSKTALDSLEEASAKLKGNVLMAYSGVKDGLDKRLADYIGITGVLP